MSASREAGDTLIEILIALTILGLTGVALLGAFASDLSGAVTYQNSSTIATVLKNFSDEATFEIQYQTTPSPLFQACATLSGTATSSGSAIDYNGTTLSYIPPPGYTVSVTNIEYLYQNSSFSSSCDSGQLEPQLITVRATGPKGANGTLSFVVASFNNESYVQPS